MIEAGSRIPQEYRPAESQIAVCARCGGEILKRNGVAIYVKHGSIAQVKVLLHFCRSCYANFLEDYGVGE